MKYQTLRAIRKAHIPINISSDGRVFMVVVASDKKMYQVKFNLTTTKANQNELITHFIGSKMNAPVLCGAFIEFSHRVLSNIITEIQKHSCDIDTSCFVLNTLFGVEWHEAVRYAKSEEEVKSFIGMCKNKNDFFAIYSFDQYVKNYDRQHFNHIIIKRHGEKKPSHYATIDGDKIFNSTAWDKLSFEYDCFKCMSYDFHKMLYDLVDDKSYKRVVLFATNINNILDDDIELLVKTMNENYSDIKLEHSKIADILKHRKSKILDSCDGNCFANVKNKRLSENANERL